MKRTRGFALGMIMLALSGSSVLAQSGGTPGPYVRLEAGWVHPEDLSGSGVNGITNGTAKRDDGFIVGGAGGYKWGPWRAELNLDYSENGVRNGTNVYAGGSGMNANLSGDSTNLAFMINGYYDIALPWQVPITPYVGFGIGGDHFTLDKVHVSNAANTPIANGGDFVFAFQPIVGVSYAINTQWSAGLEYRYFRTTDAKIHYSVGTAQNNINVDPTQHEVLASITFHFGAPPPPPPPTPAAAPPPPPPPAPAARQEFIVFFEFDKSTLTPEGKDVVDRAAAAYKRGGSLKMSIAGYTDRAGTPSYNMRLSQRRAETVRAALVADGVPDNQIAVAWYGEENNRVPTANGVREPQNRRVEIEF